MIPQRIYEYFDRNPWLHVLFIFDKMEVFAAELNDAEWNDNYKFLKFDGKWFSIKYHVEHDWKNKRVVLLFDGDKFKRPTTEEEMMKFPLLDLLEANLIYQEEDHAAFLQQYHISQIHSPFVKRNIRELRAAKVNKLLSGYLSESEFNPDTVIRAIITSYLKDSRLLDWYEIIAKMIIIGNEPDKARGDFFRKLEANLDAYSAVEKKLTEIFGHSYQKYTPERMKTIAESLKYNSLTQLIDLKQGDNYRNYKVTTQKRFDQINKIYEYGSRNKKHGEKFQNALEVLASTIKEEEILRIYGVDSNYYQITPTLLWHILKHSLENTLYINPKETGEKAKEWSLQLPDDKEIQSVISFIIAASEFYLRFKKIGSVKFDTPTQYINAYLDELWEIDMFYRKMIDAFYFSTKFSNPLEIEVYTVKARIDKEYADFTNLLNYEWLKCVKEKGNYFDNIEILKQNDFYGSERNNSVQHQVIIISDALRYEVGKQLMEKISAGKRHVADIIPMIAMLPTETKYTKTSLLPHSKLKLNGEDMEVDGKVLNLNEDRTKQLRKFFDNSLCIDIKKINQNSSATNRELFKKYDLVYIFQDKIDDTGHGQDSKDTVRACNEAVDELSDLIFKLHSSWNVTDVIITSDHGFIFNDIIIEEKDKHRITEMSIEKKTRYYLTPISEQEEGIIKFPLSRVSAMQSSELIYVATPLGTNRFAAPSGGYNFAHGGAALQELIIPVIRSKQKRSDKQDYVTAKLFTTDPKIVMNQFMGHILQKEVVSMTRQATNLKIGIYNGDELVSPIIDLNLSSVEDDPNKRLYPIIIPLNKNVTATVLQIKAYRKEDMFNPLFTENVKNVTLIENDFDDF